MKPTIIEAIRSLDPSALWGVANDVLIDWVSPNGVPQPTVAELDTEIARLQDIYDANAYARSRKTAYDALNQLELISDDAINGTTTHADAILAIKAEFPKP